MRIGRFLTAALGSACASFLVFEALAQSGPSPARIGDAAVETGSTAALESQRQVLFTQMLSDPSNLDVAFEYAALSARVGDLEGAVATLERMLIFAPGLPRLQLELGVLYYRVGAYEVADNYFEQAISGEDVPQEVVERVQTFRTGINRATEPTRFSGTIAAGVRYQSNANAAPETRDISLFGLDFLLDEDAVSAPDVNGFIAGTARISHDLESQGDRLEINVSGYGALYDERTELNAALGEVTIGPVFNMERFRIDNTTLAIYGIAGGVILDEDPYLVSGGIGTNLVTQGGQGTSISIRGEYRYEDYRDSVLRPTASNKTGDRYRAEVELQQQLTDRFAFIASAEAEKRDAETEFDSNRAFGASLGARMAFADPLGLTDTAWTVSVVGGLLRRDYDGNDPTVSADAQSDREAFVDVTLAMPVADGWSMLASGGYRDVDSNYAMKKFDNVTGTLTLLRQF